MSAVRRVSGVERTSPGIRVRRVVLSSQPDRAVFVVDIPQGSTAYQANDRRYYGRSEFEIKPLPDHEVRLRMSRGKVARGIVFLRIVEVALGAARENAVRAEIRAREEQRAKQGSAELSEIVPLPDGKSTLMSQKAIDAQALLSASMFPDLVTFDFVFRNEGELTIRAPAIEFREARNERLFNEGLVAVNVPKRLKLEDAIIYPGDEEVIKLASSSSLSCKREIVLAAGDCTLSWKVFLDNSPPSSGEIDVASEVETARRQDFADR